MGRLQVMNAMKGMEWNGHVAVMLASSLIECCMTESDCEVAIEKIDDTLTQSLRHLTGDNENLLNTELCVDIEELPQLLYQLTLLGNKLDGGLSPDLSSQILDCITMSTDTLLSLYFLSDQVANKKRKEKKRRNSLFHRRT